MTSTQTKDVAKEADPNVEPYPCMECGLDNNYMYCAECLTKHCPVEDCPDAECLMCSIRDCPQGCELHYHHDGCICDMPVR